MGIVTLASGVDINTSGGLRILELEKKFYIVGQNMLIPANSMERPLKNVQFCSRSRKAKIITTPVLSAGLLGRQEYIEYFEN